MIDLCQGDTNRGCLWAVIRHLICEYRLLVISSISPGKTYCLPNRYHPQSKMNVMTSSNLELVCLCKIKLCICNGIGLVAYSFNVKKISIGYNNVCMFNLRNIDHFSCVQIYLTNTSYFLTKFDIFKETVTMPICKMNLKNGNIRKVLLEADCKRWCQKGNFMHTYVGHVYIYWGFPCCIVEYWSHKEISHIQSIFHLEPSISLIHIST